MTNFLRDSSFSPVVVCAFFFSASYVLQAHRWRVPWRILSLLLISLLAACAIAYLVLPVLAEDTETDIAAIAAVAMRGEAVYPDPASPDCYMLLYGPLTYLAHIPFYFAFGTNLLSFKLLGFLSFGVAIVSLYRVARLYASASISLTACGCAGVILLRYLPVPFWGRIDSLILGVVGLAYWISLRSSIPLTVVSTALAIGIVTNLKFTAILYLLPLLGLVWMRLGRKVAIAAALLGGVLVFVPFLIPNVSFRNYLYVIRLNGRHGLETKILLRNWQYTALLLVPVLLLFFSRNARREDSRSQQRIYLALITFSMLISAIFGGKAGAGSYHLLPYIVPLLHAYLWIRTSLPEVNPDAPFQRIALAWVASILLFSAAQLHSFADCLRFTPQGARASGEIIQSETKYGVRAVQVGVGNNFLDRQTFYAFMPAQRGGPYTLSASTVRDMQFAGAPLPESTLRYFSECKTPVWLIPAGEQPFTAPNTYYAAAHPAFSDEFRRTFLSNYRKTDTAPLFDTWVCSH